MSTKTNFKRVALVAVAALGLGVLTSVAPASATANVNLGDPSTFMISVKPTITGSGVANGALTQSASKGWVSKTSTNGTANNGGTADTIGYDLTSAAPAATGVVLAGAQIAFNLAGPNTTATGLTVVVTGGSLSQVRNAALDSTATPTVSTDGTTAVLVQNATTAGRLIGNATISAAAGTTATIAAYTGTGITGTSTATVGALIGIWTLTVGASNTTGVYNAANSTIATQVAFTKSTTASGNLAFDDNSRIANGGVGAIWYSLKDAFLSPITTGSLAVTSTNSAGVLISGTVATALPFSATTAFHTLAVPADGEGWIIVNQPVSNTAGSSTVTITLDGQVLATKTLNWNGDVASLSVDTVNSQSNLKNGADLTFAGGLGGIIYVAKDAAGNAVDIATAPTVTGATGALVGASIAAITATSNGALQNSITGYGYNTMSIPSSSLNGKGTYQLQVLNSGGVAVKSQTVTVNVSASSGLDSFAASWDKASYAPGEIAVLTVTGKDTLGNVIADGTAAAGLSLTVAGSATAGLSAVGTACTTATTFSGGKFTCKYSANSEGAWSYSVDVTTNINTQSPTVGSLKVTSGGGVSNADVLKAIVSLIASINKQIAALQKALLKK
jgi:trimeric autotransporter adhesin